jgi:hypothetical protein
MARGRTKKRGKSDEPENEDVETEEIGAEDAAAESVQATPGTLPLLYRQPVPLNPERHGGTGLAKRKDYSFAAEANSVPLNAAEFKVAMKFYPIVFAGADPVMTVVILGLRDGRNLYVGQDGTWEKEHYIPAYIRRYPFIFMAGQDRKQYLLCVDEGSGLLDKGAEDQFFDGTEPTDLTKRALDFCTAYQSQSELTKAFAGAMSEAGLLVPNRAEITTKGGEKMALGGFRVIDEEKLANTPDETFLDWRRKGYLPLIYCHLYSTSNWSSLLNRY